MNISFFDKESRQQVISHIDKIQSSFSNDSEHIFSDLQGALIVDYTRPGNSSLFRHKHLKRRCKIVLCKDDEDAKNCNYVS